MEFSGVSEAGSFVLVNLSRFVREIHPERCWRRVPANRLAPTYLGVHAKFAHLPAAGGCFSAGGVELLGTLFLRATASWSRAILPTHQCRRLACRQFGGHGTD